MKYFASFGILYCSIFLFSYFSIAPIASAQLGIGLSASDVSLTLNPENPAPGEQVTISIDSFATDLNSAPITWYVNGKKVLSGKGNKQFTVTAGKLGQKTSVAIVIDSQAGTVEKDISIVPSSVDLIWEADTYTPPFFKGRPLFSPEANITFVAVPHILRGGSEIAASNLVYKWSNNGTVLGSQGGYGKSSLTISGSIIPRPMNITVEASDPVSGAIADGGTIVTPQTPFVLLYKNDPLYGVQYEKALQGSFPLTQNEINITAVPYHFSARTLADPLLAYTWQINGLPINDGVNVATKAFRQTGDAFGTSNISVSVSNTNTIFQSAQSSVLINFQKPTSQTSL